MCVFGVVVAWSIYTSGKKACQLRKAEKEKEAKEKGDYVMMEDTPMEMMEMDNTGLQAIGCDHGHAGAEGAANEEHVEKETPELLAIKANENKHFEMKRILYYFVNFCILFGASEIVKSPDIATWARWVTLFAYIIVALIFTKFSIVQVDKIHEIKNRDHYNWDEKDLRFHNKV